MRRDTYEKRERPMDEYLSEYGWHFNKKMAEWAIGKMKDRNGGSVRPKDHKTIIESMQSYGIKTDKIEPYDAVYVEAMARADYYGSSLMDDVQVYKFVGDYLNDPDGYDGIALTRFYADSIGKGMPIYWEDML